MLQLRPSLVGSSDDKLVDRTFASTFLLCDNSSDISCDVKAQDNSI